MKNPLILSRQNLIIGAVQGQSQDAFAYEAQRIEVQTRPVDLEPIFRPCTGGILIADPSKYDLRPKWHQQESTDFCFIRLWFPEQNNKPKWQNFDLLGVVAVVKNPIYFLIIGNKETITHILAVNSEDLTPLKNALKAKWPEMECELSSEPFAEFSKAFNRVCSENQGFGLRDYYAHPAYWRRLTVREHLKSSPLLSIYSSLSGLDEDELGFYQVIFKPTLYPWHKNILNLIEFENEIAKYGNINISDWYYPGFGDKENRNKVSSPMLAVSVRIGVFCKHVDLDGILKSLSLAQGYFQFSGENLRFLSKEDYSGVIDTAKGLFETMESGVVYHSGNLFNTEETSYFVHIPIEEIISNETYRIDKISGFNVPESFKGEGVIIGYNEHLGKRTLVHQPEKVRKNHTAIIGIIDKGKSILMENMILEDIQNGRGVGLIDPHGTLAERVIRQISKKDISRTIYFELPEVPCTPCCNFFKDGDIYKIVDDNVNRFKHLYPASAWGHSIEDILRHCFYAICVAPELSLSDVRILLARNSAGENLRGYILPYLKNEEEELFWTEDFRHLTSPERVTSKLTLFLQPERAKRFFSQRENKIDFRRIIDNKMIFIASIRAGVLGHDLTNIIGSCLFSSFYNAGMSRMDLITTDDLAQEIGVPFNLYVDEFHRFPTKSLEHSLRELRKFNVRVNLALQQKEYLSTEIKSAMGNIGTWVVLALGWEDAQMVFKEFYGEVSANSFMRGKTGNGFVRISEDITNIKTFPPKKLTDIGFRDEIIRYSREHYYSLVDEAENKVTPQKSIIRAVYDEI